MAKHAAWLDLRRYLCIYWRCDYRACKKALRDVRMQEQSEQMNLTAVTRIGALLSKITHGCEINFSAKILSKIVQNTYFDTRPRLKISQNRQANRLVKQVNKPATCTNEKCRQAKRRRNAFRRSYPRVKVGILYNLSQKIARKINKVCFVITILPLTSFLWFIK